MHDITSLNRVTVEQYDSIEEMTSVGTDKDESYGASNNLPPSSS